jgi:hypothetical protein
MATERNAPAGDAADLDDDVDGRVAALYGGPLAEFVAQRDALAKSLRAAGRRDVATRVRALKKPKALAWALDAGAHAEPAALTDLTAAVEEVGEAQLSGGDVRSALSRLRAAETAVVAAAGAAAAGHGHPVDGTAVAAGLRAVVGDPDALAALGAGRLVDVPGTSGFGVAPPASAPGPSPGATDADREAAVAAAHRAVAEAERAAQDAAAGSRTAAAAADEAAAAARQAEDEALAARRHADAAADAARQARVDAEARAARQAEADAALAAARDALHTIGSG